MHFVCGDISRIGSCNLIYVFVFLCVLAGGFVIAAFYVCVYVIVVFLRIISDGDIGVGV